MKRIPFAAAAFLAACVGGADDLPPSPTDADSAAIIGGTIDEGDPAVANLQVYEKRPAGNVMTHNCTASLIAPTVLLTAAHCMDFRLVDSGPVGRALFGTEVSEAGYWVNVNEVHYDPEFNGSNVRAGHDIAVAILEEPVAIAPLPYNRAPMTEDMVGASGRLIGFGLDEDFWDGTKRHVTTFINTVTPLLVGLGDADHHTCTGDSGGPALMDVNGVPTIIGVTSFGAAIDGNVCVDGWHTRVDLYTDFIDPFVSAP
ncbi:MULTISPECIES: S1 family peptidase [Sorangium]|uniref:S1 family peptidase n=1 Tax=Sorangium TaxID=39643 RepID=UPI003D9BFFAD